MTIRLMTDSLCFMYVRRYLAPTSARGQPGEGVELAGNGVDPTTDMEIWRLKDFEVPTLTFSGNVISSVT